MSSFINAMDNTKHFGENGHMEYYKKNMDVTQYFFQLVRSKETTHLEKTLEGMLTTIYANEKLYELEFKSLFKLVAQTRDIIAGKGEYDLAFMQIMVWYDYYPTEIKKLVELFVLPYDKDMHPYGSWKDIKYLCNYLKKRKGEDHPLIDYCIELMLYRLKLDIDNMLRYENNDLESGYTLEHLKKDITLVGKWVPREKSSFKWIHHILAYKLFPEFLETATTRESLNKARIKCKIHLNKYITRLNKYLDTVQIKQCAGQYSSINYGSVTSLTNRKQRMAFLNKLKNGSVRSHNPDRIYGSEKYKNYIQSCMTDSTKKINGRRCNVYELVKDALNAYDQDEINSINLQWRDNSKNNNSLKYMIPMADTSGSMECDNCVPLYNSIGLSIRVSEKCHPAFQNRILTFDSNPQWIALNNNLNFVEKAKIVKNASWGMNTNFYAACDKILNGIVQSDMTPEEVENMVLVVFSDMQIDASLRRNETMNSLYENIRKKYQETGLNSRYNCPFKPPHILFWNLRSTEGFPCLSDQKNVTYLSGYSSTLLNLFTEKGIEGLREYTPRKALHEVLSHERYNFLDLYLKKYFENTHLKWE
jgi:hypothetical protein